MRGFGIAHDLDRLLPLMQSKGVTLSAAQFQSAVNLIFHECEAERYDELHADMRSSLPQQFALLINDLIAADSFPNEPLRILDIGGGTGQSAELLLDQLKMIRVAQLDLLDTSPKMIELCAKRKSIRSYQPRFIRGTLADLKESSRYNLILCCSVLHHIPDLEEFGSKLQTLQPPGGVFLHLQDPNGAALASSVLRRRMKALEAAPEVRLRSLSSRLHPQRLANRARRMLGLPVPRSYMETVNEALLASGVAAVPLTDDEIWSVTDLRVHDGKGVETDSLQHVLPGYRLVSQRSYAFYGGLDSTLPARFRKGEQELIRRHSLDGMQLAAAWKRTRQSI